MLHGYIPPHRFLPYLSWTAIDGLAGKADTVIVLPVGAIEQHGPHLPCSVDSVISSGVLGKALEKLPADIPAFGMMPITYGKSDEHLQFPGTMTLTGPTLLATVIEVGVDVPRASVMVVMDADRFGVSQLHQLRGRVGRGGLPGLCLLVHSGEPDAAHERLDAVAGTTDGFELAASVAASLLMCAAREEYEVSLAAGSVRLTALPAPSVLDGTCRIDPEPGTGTLGEQVATLDRALLAALLICYVGAVVSAFASTTGILGALIPLAVPFLETGAVGAVGLIIALSISSSVVDSSPFSTSGALTVANTPADHRERVFKRLMQWGMSMVVIAPPIAWLVFVVPGWL